MFTLRTKPMQWWTKIFGRDKHNYNGPNFHVRIEPIFREAVSVIYSHEGRTFTFGAERTGRKWSGIYVVISEDITASEASRIAQDLAIAFEAMENGYLIVRKLGVEIVPNCERQTAITELRELGLDIEVLGDGKLRQTKRPDAPKRDLETLKQQTPRIMSLIQAVQGTRPRFETLVKSKEFE